MPTACFRIAAAALVTTLATVLPLCAQDEEVDLKIGVYYYPWHAGDFHGGRYLRQRLDPPQHPQLGEYNDREADVIRQHAEWSRYAGIGCWIASWWGPGTRGDVTLREHVLESPDLDGIEIAIHYETGGRTRGFANLEALESDFAYLGKNYFEDEHYLEIDGRPVVVVYLTRVLQRRGLLEAAVEAMRAGAASAGHEVYLIGDHAFGRAPESNPALSLLDAVTNYDVYGAMGCKGHAEQAGVDSYTKAQTAWRELAHGVGTDFVPCVTPGFNDTAVRSGHAPLSRKLGPEAEFGSLFRTLLKGAVPLTDAGSDRLLLVTSWNEWHEDTTIEPVELAPATSEDDRSGELTRGISYEGYAKRYLDILREANRGRH